MSKEGYSRGSKLPLGAACVILVLLLLLVQEPLRALSKQASVWQVIQVNPSGNCCCIIWQHYRLFVLLLSSMTCCFVLVGFVLTQ